ncbi:TetR/AcrR family transcriptional regulator [Stappia indica]|uniref:TetR/AcrR family transcriptional regulator n=1 Tax=Stappia indica TaxID=538381 RepID=UPI001CD38336|nr:TetR/AcrR family transcriptional regulator [Stappia indica]MCA1299727.1 TetR/AcrR family transcriptional regulator [Stappia indica]
MGRDQAMSEKKRLSPQERERQIVDEAIRFFAEQGFGGQTRELAKRLGITQPLLYRYFSSKEALIERVYQDVFVGRWKENWQSLITDRSQPIRQRLLRLYGEYAEVIDNREWVRILILAGMKGESLNRRYLDQVREKIIEPLCREMRFEAGLPDPDTLPLDEAERDLVWSFHGTFIYRGIRKWVYGIPVMEDSDTIVETAVTAFLEGAPAALSAILADRLD